MAQLQARYPNASLVAEFVTVHQERLVVRALVQVGGIPLATGMAAATDIEQAEDRAKIRALTALGIGGFTTSTPPQSSAYSIPTVSSLPTPNLSPTPSFSSANLAPPDSSIAATPPGDVPHLATNPSPVVAPDPSLPDPSLNVTNSASFSDSFAAGSQTESSNLESSNPESSNLESDRAEYELSYEPETDQSDRYEPEVDLHAEASPLSEPGSLSLEAIEPPSQTSSPVKKAASAAEPTKPATTGKGKTTKRKPESTEIAPSTAGENDRSEEIAKIGLEMKRLGWTTEQGRNYLKRTYGKRSRQELDDSELIDFLRYLEAQISPSESSF